MKKINARHPPLSERSNDPITMTEDALKSERHMYEIEEGKDSSLSKWRSSQQYLGNGNGVTENE